MHFISFVFLFFLNTHFAFSESMPIKSQSLQFILTQIEVNKTSETLGDELYFDITVAKAHKPTLFLRVPEQPMHWPSQQINKIKNITLWKGELKANEEITFLLSLNEQDNAPINVDDLIGSMHVTVKNKEGMLLSEWITPGKNEKIEIKKDKKFHHARVIFQGDGAKYHLFFELVISGK